MLTDPYLLFPYLLFPYLLFPICYSPICYSLFAIPLFAIPSYYGHSFLFQGHEYLRNLGIYDFRYRFYNPSLGRFIQTDPLGLQMEGAKLSAEQTALYPAGQAPKTFNASELNLYRYCHNDPINKSDPMGLYFNITGGDKDWQRKTATDLKKNERDLVNAVKNNVKGAAQALKDFRALKSDKNYEVKIVPAGQTTNGHNNYDPRTKAIGYEAYKQNNVTGRDADGSLNRDASVALGHEVGHAVDDYFGRLSHDIANDPLRFPNCGEEGAVYFENVIRAGRWPDDPGRQRPQY